jgi:hypothetical protein
MLRGLGGQAGPILELPPFVSTLKSRLLKKKANIFSPQTGSLKFDIRRISPAVLNTIEPQ